jgi:antibiotic biosynthesis monooxygenase (ABM) superfamily enzyme
VAYNDEVVRPFGRVLLSRGFLASLVGTPCTLQANTDLTAISQLTVSLFISAMLILLRTYIISPDAKHMAACWMQAFCV